MNFRLYLCLAALAVSLVAGAQNLKPVKDKATKKYGYQDGSKNWVIAPTFDDAKRFDDDGCALVKVNNRHGLINGTGEWVLEPLYDDIGKFNKSGLCDIMIKEGKTKYHGVADRDGHIILPVEYRSVKIPKNGEYITASIEVAEEGLEGEPLWGIYNSLGGEIFSPQFRSAPSYYNNGTFIAKDGRTGLEGVVDMEGRVLIPFDNLAVSHSGNGYHGLEKTFARTIYSNECRLLAAEQLPGSIVPYDVAGDPVRAAAWHSGVIGTRIHSNQIRLVQGQTSYSGSLRCAKLDLDWGYHGQRFLRLEPVEAEEDDPDAMENPLSGKRYTLKAILYEPDGTLAGVISDRGWLEAECLAGVLYRAGGEETWLVMNDPNSPSIASTVSFSGQRTLTHNNVLDGMGISHNDLLHLGNVRRFADRQIDILQGENIGITSYIIPPVDTRYSRIERNVARAELFRHYYRMEDVVSCRVATRSDGIEVSLKDELVCHFNDHLSDPYYTMSGDELIYWGPHNNRTIRINLIPSYDGMEDDVAGSGTKWSFVISLFEEDGTWLRTLATIPYADYVQDGIVVFKNAGIALLNPVARRKGPLLRLTGAQPAPHSISALSAFRPR